MVLSVLDCDVVSLGVVYPGWSATRCRRPSEGWLLPASSRAEDQSGRLLGGNIDMGCMRIRGVYTRAQGAHDQKMNDGYRGSRRTSQLTQQYTAAG